MGEDDQFPRGKRPERLISRIPFSLFLNVTLFLSLYSNKLRFLHRYDLRFYRKIYFIQFMSKEIREMSKGK